MIYFRADQATYRIDQVKRKIFRPVDKEYEFARGIKDGYIDFNDRKDVILVPYVLNTSTKKPIDLAVTGVIVPYKKGLEEMLGNCLEETIFSARNSMLKKGNSLKIRRRKKPLTYIISPQDKSWQQIVKYLEMSHLFTNTKQTTAQIQQQRLRHK